VARSGAGHRTGRCGPVPAAARPGRTIRSWPLLALAAPAAEVVPAGSASRTRRGFGLVSPAAGHLALPPSGRRYHPPGPHRAHGPRIRARRVAALAGTVHGSVLRRREPGQWYLLFRGIAAGNGYGVLTITKFPAEGRWRSRNSRGERGRVGLDLAITQAGAFLPTRTFGRGGPMARRTEAALAQASDRIRQQNGATYLRPDAAAPRPRPRASQAASTDSARTSGATGGVDLEAILHLAHLHARGDPGPGSVVLLAKGPVSAGRRWPSTANHWA